MLKTLFAGTKGLLIILLLFSSACSREDDLIMIRDLIKKGGALAEKHDIQGLLALTSGDFAAFPEGHDRQGVGEWIVSSARLDPFRGLGFESGRELRTRREKGVAITIINPRRCRNV